MKKLIFLIIIAIFFTGCAKHHVERINFTRINKKAGISIKYILVKKMKHYEGKEFWVETSEVPSGKKIVLKKNETLYLYPSIYNPKGKGYKLIRVINKRRKLLYRGKITFNNTIKIPFPKPKEENEGVVMIEDEKGALILILCILKYQYKPTRKEVIKAKNKVVEVKTKTKL